MNWVDIEKEFKKEHGLDDSQLFQWLVKNYNAPEKIPQSDKEFVLSVYPDAYYKKDTSGYTTHPHVIRKGNGQYLAAGYFTELQGWRNAAAEIQRQEKIKP